MTVPNKWIRKMIFDLIDDINVDGILVPCYDVRATDYEGDLYTLISTQTMVPDNRKCGYAWRSTVELQAINVVDANAGSRLLVDNLSEAILTAIENAQPDVASNLVISYRRIEMPGDLTTEANQKLIYQNIIRLTYGIS